MIITIDIPTEPATTLAQTAKEAGFTKDVAGLTKYIKFLLKLTYVNQKQKEARVISEATVETARTAAEAVII